MSSIISNVFICFSSLSFVCVISSSMGSFARCCSLHLLFAVFAASSAPSSHTSDTSMLSLRTMLSSEPSPRPIACSTLKISAQTIFAHCCVISSVISSQRSASSSLTSPRLPVLLPLPLPLLLPHLFSESDVTLTTILRKSSRSTSRSVAYSMASVVSFRTSSMASLLLGTFSCSSELCARSFCLSLMHWTLVAAGIEVGMRLLFVLVLDFAGELRAFAGKLPHNFLRFCNNSTRSKESVAVLVIMLHAPIV
mmetsp:Transcript_21363/g.39916  ORF Transcript_21363/g.39916 Transcript_21363/m.39916 type:complete len:252 (-) Transcript_21363:23-778(-)